MIVRCRSALGKPRAPLIGAGYAVMLVTPSFRRLWNADSEAARHLR